PVNPEPSSRDPLVESLRHRQQRSLGELFAAKFDYTFLRLGQFDATVTYSFFASYPNDLPSFSIVGHLGGLGLGYRGEVRGVPYQLGLQYAYDYLTLGGDEFVQRHTVTPNAVVSWNPHNLTALQLRLQTKEYSDDTNIAREDKRDAVNYLVGVLHV